MFSAARAARWDMLETVLKKPISASMQATIIIGKNSGLSTLYILKEKSQPYMSAYWLMGNRHSAPPISGFKAEAACV